MPVLDEPVVLSLVCSVSDGEDTVVQPGGAASGFVINSGFVHLERSVVGVNGDRDWANCCDSLLKLSLASALDVHEANIGGANVGRVKDAFLVLKKRKIGVIIL